MRNIHVRIAAIAPARLSAYRAFAWAIALIVVSATTPDSTAQMFVQHTPGRLHTNQSAKIYLSYSGAEKFDGSYLALPINWTLRDVVLLSESGIPQGISFKQSEQYDNRYYLFADNGFSDKDQIVLEFETGSLTSAGMIRMVPFQMDRRRFEPIPRMFEADAVSARFNIYDPILLSRNRVLKLVYDQPGVVIPMKDLPDLSAGASYTAELWLKTATSDAIVLSTWDGNEDTSYPIELTIDESGHIVFFKGVKGEHQTMRSNEPVADGTWHHVAVTYDNDAGISRLLIDGNPSDSLFGATNLAIEQPQFFSISGRAIRQTRDSDDQKRLNALVDEVRLWPEALSVNVIRRGMRQAMKTSVKNMLVLSFDEDVQESPVSRRIRHLDLVQSDLSFHEELRRFELQVDAGTVLLSWIGEDPETVGFTVERSVDGANFEDLSIVIANIDESGSEGSYRYRDIDAPDSVAFYRIRQRYSDGAERVSTPIKVGMGSDDASLSASLTGNYPNPFNPVSTITYFVREQDDLEITVWDLAGQQIIILYTGSQTPGEHQVVLDAREYPSGTYFVRLQSGTGVSSRRIVLMK